MESSWVSQAKAGLSYFCGTIHNDAIEGVATHIAWGCSYQSIARSVFGCSGTQIHDPEVIDEGSGKHWDNNRVSLSWFSVRTRLKPVQLHHKQKS